MFIQGLLIVFLLMLIVLTGIDPALAAAKKKKSKTDIEVEKTLTPVMEQLTPLSQKGSARGLFSPDDMAKLAEVKLQLLDLIKDYPTSEMLIKPAYQAARLFKSREQYDDAYDFLNYIQTNFPTSPYAAQAKVEIQRMKQQLGDSYFAGNLPSPAGATP